MPPGIGALARARAITPASTAVSSRSGDGDGEGTGTASGDGGGVRSVATAPAGLAGAHPAPATNSAAKNSGAATTHVAVGMTRRKGSAGVAMAHSVLVGDATAISIRDELRRVLVPPPMRRSHVAAGFSPGTRGNPVSLPATYHWAGAEHARGAILVPARVNLTNS